MSAQEEDKREDRNNKIASEDGEKSLSSMSLEEKTECGEDKEAEAGQESPDEAEAPSGRDRMSSAESSKSDAAESQGSEGPRGEPEDGPRGEDGGPESQPRRRSSVRRQLLAMQRLLDPDEIEKGVESMHPEQDRRPSEQEGQETKEEPRKAYLSTAMAAMFIVSASTGGAISGLAFFLMQSGWFGVFLILLLGFNAIYSGLCTGWSWCIMEKMWPEYLENSRVPYQDIGYRASSRTWIKYAVEIFTHVTILSSCGCYLVFMADSVTRAMGNGSVICLAVIIIVIVLIPFMFFGSYSDMKFVGLLDVMMSIVYTFLTIVSIFLDKPSVGPATYTRPSASSVMVAFSGMFFAYGVGAVMPNIMAEMADRSKFTGTCVTAYMVIIAIYVVLPIIGYAAYGDDTPSNILNHIYENPNLYYFGVVLDCIHLVQMGTTFIVAIMPTMQSFEERLHCPNRFGVARAAIRLITLFCLLIVVLAVPYIPSFMPIIGAIAMNVITFVLPPMFYVGLAYKKKKKTKRSEMNKSAWILIVEIVLLAVVVGSISLYVSVSHFIAYPIQPRDCFTNMSLTHVPDEMEKVS